jgi:hypothetical protein
VPTVAELSAPYGNFMLGPRPGPDVCSACFNLTDGWGRCHACAQSEQWLDAVAPISYSVAGEQLHHALLSYKRLVGAGGRHFAMGLAAVLWRYLARHERCLADAAGVESFAVVTTVPSSDVERGTAHPLGGLVSELVGPVRDRYEPALRRSAVEVAPHRFSAQKYAPRREMTGSSVLLIDDTWTTGANAQSAAAALKAAGASAVAAVVIGRHVNRGWRHNDRHLAGLPRPFDWEHCALCDGGRSGAPGAA